MTPKIAGGPIPHTIDETDPASVEMENYRMRSRRRPRPASGIKLNPHGHVDPMLLDHVRAILVERRRCCTILELAEETARRMGGQLPDGAKMYPAHPSRLAIADCVHALGETGELDQILNQTPKPLEANGDRGGTAGAIGPAVPAADPPVSGGGYLWLTGEKGP